MQAAVDIPPTQIVSCPRCGRRNRIPSERTGELRCGACKTSFKPSGQVEVIVEAPRHRTITVQPPPATKPARRQRFRFPAISVATARFTVASIVLALILSYVAVASRYDYVKNSWPVVRVDRWSGQTQVLDGSGHWRPMPRH